MLLTRGPEAQLPRGSTLDIVLERDLTLEGDQVRFTDVGTPRPSRRRRRASNKIRRGTPIAEFLRENFSGIRSFARFHETHGAEARPIHADTLFRDPVANQPRGNGSQQDSAAKMSCGDQQSFHVR